MDDKMKPLDRGQYVQFLTEFPSDKADYEKLRECLEYMRHQVKIKQDELIQAERDIAINKRLLRDADMDTLDNIKQQ
jgi:hypothetical protein